jgi:hypothetical protein
MNVDFAVGGSEEDLGDFVDFLEELLSKGWPGLLSKINF